MSVTDWQTHPMRDQWEAQRRARYAHVRRALQAQRDRVPALDAPLLDCLNAGRPFCFLRTVGIVERVALRDAWESCNSL